MGAEIERGEAERDVASVAAVIKLRAEGRAGSSASLMSVRSACVSSVALPPWSAPEERSSDGWGLSSLCFCPLWRG